MARVCVDACFLIGLYDKDDQHHTTAIRQFEALFGKNPERNQLIAPWPILYECLSSRFARDPRKSALLTQRWKYLSDSAQLRFLDDSLFREKCLEEHLGGQSRPLSLVDRVLRALIEDRPRPFEFFVTYNTGDFRDACERAGVYLLNEQISPESYGI